MEISVPPFVKGRQSQRVQVKVSHQQRLGEMWSLYILFSLARTNCSRPRLLLSSLKFTKLRAQFQVYGRVSMNSHSCAFLFHRACPRTLRTTDQGRRSIMSSQELERL